MNMLDTLIPVWQHAARMSARENQFSLTPRSVNEPSASYL